MSCNPGLSVVMEGLDNRGILGFLGRGVEEFCVKGLSYGAFGLQGPRAKVQSKEIPLRSSSKFLMK